MSIKKRKKCSWKIPLTRRARFRTQYLISNKQTLNQIETNQQNSRNKLNRCFNENEHFPQFHWIGWFIFFLLFSFHSFGYFEIKLRTINQRFIRIRTVHCSMLNRNNLLIFRRLDASPPESEVNLSELSGFNECVYHSNLSLLFLNALHPNSSWVSSMLTELRWVGPIKRWKIKDLGAVFFSRYLSTRFMSVLPFVFMVDTIDKINHLKSTSVGKKNQNIRRLCDILILTTVNYTLSKH